MYIYIYTHTHSSLVLCYIYIWVAFNIMVPLLKPYTEAPVDPTLTPSTYLNFNMIMYSRGLNNYLYYFGVPYYNTVQ